MYSWGLDLSSIVDTESRSLEVYRYCVISSLLLSFKINRCVKLTSYNSYKRLTTLFYFSIKEPLIQHPVGYISFDISGLHRLCKWFTTHGHSRSLWASCQCWHHVSQLKHNTHNTWLVFTFWCFLFCFAIISLHWQQELFYWCLFFYNLFFTKSL